MTEREIVLRNDERVIFELRNLFRRFGYVHYKVNKFEEYDFYARNRSFLSGEHILTFTDTNGKLMALKPDITMSIIKNAKDTGGALQKLYYNENVYRPAGENGFREIVQTGLECIGDVDLYAMGEVLMLACESLNVISEQYLLDISHIGVVAGLLEAVLPAGADRSAIFRSMGEKNGPALAAACAAAGVDAALLEKLQKLTMLYGTLPETLPVLRSLTEGAAMTAALEELEALAEILTAYGLAEKVRLDFSIPNDGGYYSGIVFRGYVDGIPREVLCGGRYDNLLQKMGRAASGFGFAVYLDRLELFRSAPADYDVDILLLYEPETAPQQVIQAIRMLRANGSTVRADKKISPGLKYRQLLGVREGGVVILENHD